MSSGQASDELGTTGDRSTAASTSSNDAATGTPPSLAVPRPSRNTHTPGAPATVDTTLKPYHQLSYAPRQSSSRSNSAQSVPKKDSSQANDIPAPPSQPSASNGAFSNPPPVSPLRVTVQDGPTEARERESRLQEAMSTSERLGLSKASPGYSLFRQLATASEGEWRELALLTGQTDVTVLLPVASKSSQKDKERGPEAAAAPSLAFAQDHIVIGPRSRPLAKDEGQDFNTSQTAMKGLVTLSGLRVVQEAAESSAVSSKIVVKSFINRADHTWVNELTDRGSRRSFFSALPALPQPCCSDYPYPNYPITSEERIPLPPLPPINPNRNRAGSTSLMASGLGLDLPSNKGHGHRASSSGGGFASLFGGGNRDRRKEAQTSAPSAASTTGSHSSPGPTNRSDDHKEQVTQQERTINVVLIDRPLRRSRALRGMTYSIQARVKQKLERKADVSALIGDFVGAFASAFYPLVDGTSADPSVKRPASSTPRMHSFTADHLTEAFQEMYTSVSSRLQGNDAVVRSQLEAVEEVLTMELYDRLFFPWRSRDKEQDNNLSSRVAALKLLGFGWEGLGLRIPAGESSETDVVEGLDSIITSAEAELTKLQSFDYFSPRRKLDVLVAVHRTIVDGLGRLPPIELKDDGDTVEQRSLEDESKASSASASESNTTRKSNTSSADLILPLLIQLLVRSNPPNFSSQLLFIQRFRSEQLLKFDGESAYCFINFQAAAQFIETAKPADLGLEHGRAEEFGLPSTASASVERNGGSAGDTSAALQLLRTVNRDQEQAQRQHRLLGSITNTGPGGGVAANVAGRVKGLSGVVNSSFSVLGKAIGSGTSAGMEAWDRSSRNLESLKSLDEIRGILGSNQSGSPKTSRTIGAEKDKVGFPTSRDKPASDYSSVSEQQLDTVLPSETSWKRDPSKPSLSDRLASLNRRPPSLSTPTSTPAEGSTSAANPLISSGALQVRPGALLRHNTSGSMGSLQTYTEPPVTEDKPLPASLQSPYPPLSSPPTVDRPLHVVLASSGSVASIKVPLIVQRLLQHANVRVQVVATKPSLHFYDGDAIDTACEDKYTVKDLAQENADAASGGASSDRLPRSSPRAHLWRDEDEWSDWKRVGDPILHIELRRWADIVLVAPLSANTLAKLAAGMCDDLLTSFLRALSPSTPTLLFPAMNTLMYRHPLTATHLSIVQETLGYQVHGPIEKTLACGDVGEGAMLEWTDIVGLVVQRFGLVEAVQGNDDVGQRRTGEEVAETPPTAGEKPREMGDK